MQFETKDKFGKIQIVPVGKRNKEVIKDLTGKGHVKKIQLLALACLGIKVELDGAPLMAGE